MPNFHTLDPFRILALEKYFLKKVSPGCRIRKYTSADAFDVLCVTENKKIVIFLGEDPNPIIPENKADYVYLKLLEMFFFEEEKGFRKLFYQITGKIL